MNRKIILVLLAVVLTASYAHAQFNMGVRAGFSLTNISEKYDGKKPDKEDRYQIKPGVQIGLTGEFAIAHGFSVQWGTLLTTNGYRLNYSGDDEGFGTWEHKHELHITYVHIPLNAQYQIDLGKMKVLLQAGPYYGYAISGTYSRKSMINGMPQNVAADVEFGSGAGEMKRTDFGVGLGAALQLGKFRAGISDHFGVMNLSNADIIKQKNQSLTFSLTYMFFNR